MVQFVSHTFYFNYVALWSIYEVVQQENGSPEIFLNDEDAENMISQGILKSF